MYIRWLEAQIDYYTKYIKSRNDWEFVQVYTDEGITGTSTKHREGFKQMIADALDGKIDLIVTKSVSRFARNTVDSLTTIRQLKEAGVEDIAIVVGYKADMFRYLVEKYGVSLVVNEDYDRYDNRKCDEAFAKFCISTVCIQYSSGSL